MAVTTVSFTTDEYSNSFRLDNSAPTRFRFPALQGGSARAYIETTEELDEAVADDDCTWDQLDDENGTAVYIPVSAAAVSNQSVYPGTLMSLCRARVKITQSDGSTPVNQAGEQFNVHHQRVAR